MVVRVWAGVLNQAFLPYHQIAVQPGAWSATTACWVALILLPQSAAQLVPAEPSVCRPGSEKSGASSEGSVCSGTALEPCTGRSMPFSQSRNACWLSLNRGLTVMSSLPLRAVGTVGLPRSAMKRFQSQ